MVTTAPAATIFDADAADTHCETNREAYKIHQSAVTQEDMVAATLAPGGGHCMWIRPQKSLTVTDLGVSLAWTSSEEETYKIERTGTLDPVNWIPVASNATEGIWTDYSVEAQAADHLFYRIQEE